MSAMNVAAEDDLPPRNEFDAGGTMPPALLALPGAERLAPFVDGSVPLSGIQLLTGVHPVSAADGVAVFRMPAEEKLLDADGRMPVGVLATLADGALGWAVVGTLPAGATCATVSLHLGLVRPIGPDGTLTAEARLVTADNRTAMSEAIITNSSGDVVALGRARLAVFRRSRRGAAKRGGAPAMHTYQGDGTGVDSNGLGSLAHAYRSCSVHGLLGMAAISAAPGAATVAMLADRRIEQTMGAVQGGALALFADRAMVTAVLTTLPPGASVYMTDVHMEFARFHDADGAPLRAAAEVRHRGRRLALTSVSIVSEHNGTVAFGTGTAVIGDAPRRG
jgi:uncharacterized protein (TIGR00369 family)